MFCILCRNFCLNDVYKYLWRRRLCVSETTCSPAQLFIHYDGAIVSRLLVEVLVCGGGPGNWASVYNVRQSNIHITATHKFPCETASSISSAILSIYEGSGRLPESVVFWSMNASGLIFWLLDLCSVQLYLMWMTHWKRKRRNRSWPFLNARSIVLEGIKERTRAWVVDPTAGQIICR